MPKGTRKLYIDYARGIMIFLIVMAHVLRKGVVTDYLASTGVAGFFFLSGLVYHWKDDRKAWWLGRLRHLYVPYLCVGAISILVYRVLGRFAASAVGTELKSSTLAGNFLALLYANSKDHSMKWNETLWFVPCFLVVLLLVSAAERLIRAVCSARGHRSGAGGPAGTGPEVTGSGERQGRGYDAGESGTMYARLRTELLLRGLTAAFCLGINCLLTQRMDARLPWQAETAFAMVPFYEAGIAVASIAAAQARNHTADAAAASVPGRSGLRSRTGRSICLLAVSVILILTEMALTRWNGQISVRGDIYTHYLPSFGIMGLGVAGWTAAGLFLDQLAPEGRNPVMRLLGRSGRKTFDIMLWNKFPVLFFQTIVPLAVSGFADLFLEQDNLRGVLTAIPITAVCCGLCMLWTDLYRWPAEHRRKRSRAV